MTTIEPKTVATFRQFLPLEKKQFEELNHLIKKYGCPVSKVSDGETWIRIYFDIPLDSKEAFLSEEK